MKRIDPLAWVLGGAIAAYRLTLSPFVGHGCRHVPSCSAYAREAVEKHGGWRGGWLALARLQRCRPGGSYGFDPVPDRLDDHPWRPWTYGIWSPSGAMARARRPMDDRAP